MTKPCLLVCRPKQWITIPEQGKHYSVDFNLHVIDVAGAILREYEPMCAAIDDAMDAEVLGAWITAIDEVIAKRAEELEKSTEAWVINIGQQKVVFDYEFEADSGGSVTLTQFKLAVSAFRDFLNDPERKPVEIPFPDA